MDAFKMVTFDGYRRHYADSYTGANPQMSVDQLLRIWEENKSKYLTKIFGDNLILSKEIVYEQSASDLHRRAEELIAQFGDFIVKYKQKVREALHYPETSYWRRPEEVGEELYFTYHDLMYLVNASSIADNRLGELHKPVVTVELNGEHIAIQSGMKTMKAFAKICAALGMTKEFEEFRLAQSMLTNQKRITGTLNLSIHPMDYATASDNANGWSSCMSWEDSGCYRLGTVEMMNSPMVVCAYISSDNVSYYCPDGDQWTSKKWRAWLIVHPQYLFINRHYPYHSDALADTVLNWAKELIADKLGWHYGPIVHDFISFWNQQSEENPAWKSNIIISTNYMYNDVGGDDIIGCMSVEHNPETDDKFQYEVNISGPAECMYCGRIIKFSECIDPSTLTCPECGEEYCARCGNVIEGDYYTTPDGDHYCEDCYTSCYTQCHYCGDIIMVEESNAVLAPYNTPTDLRWHTNCATAYLCPHCTEKLLDKGWILNYNTYEDFVFKTEEQNIYWKQHIMNGYQDLMSYINEVFILNPDPHINYTKDQLMTVFGSDTETDICSVEFNYTAFNRGRVNMKEWQENLIEPLYNTEEEE